jgi:hypothetical protein
MEQLVEGKTYSWQVGQVGGQPRQQQLQQQQQVQQVQQQQQPYQQQRWPQHHFNHASSSSAAAVATGVNLFAGAGTNKQNRGGGSSDVSGPAAAGFSSRHRQQRVLVPSPDMQHITQITNRVVTMFARARHPVLCYEMVDDALDKGVRLSASTVAICMNACVASKQYALVLKLFEELPSKHIKREYLHAFLMMEALVGLDRVEDAWESLQILYESISSTTVGAGTSNSNSNSKNEVSMPLGVYQLRSLDVLQQAIVKRLLAGAASSSSSSPANSNSSSSSSSSSGSAIGAQGLQWIEALTFTANIIAQHDNGNNNSNNKKKMQQNKRKKGALQQQQRQQQQQQQQQHPTPEQRMLDRLQQLGQQAPPAVYAAVQEHLSLHGAAKTKALLVQL